MTVDGSTITNNRALGIGGGISAYGAVTVTNTTAIKFYRVFHP